MFSFWGDTDWLRIIKFGLVTTLLTRNAPTQVFTPLQLQIKRVFDTEVQSSHRGGETSSGSLRSSAWFGDFLWHSGWSSPMKEKKRVLNQVMIKCYKPPQPSRLLQPLHSLQAWEGWQDDAEILPLMNNFDGFCQDRNW